MTKTEKVLPNGLRWGGPADGRPGSSAQGLLGLRVLRVYVLSSSLDEMASSFDKITGDLPSAIRTAPRYKLP